MHSYNIPTDNKEALIRELNELFVLGSPIDLSTLSVDQLKELRAFLLKQTLPFYMNAEISELAGRDALDKTDVGFHTFIRLWEVFSYVITNGSNSDADNPNSSFDKIINTPVAWALGMLFVFPAALGAWIRYRQIVNQREANSLQYQRVELSKITSQNQQIKPTPEDTDTAEKDILRKYNDLLARRKVVPRHLNNTHEQIENAQLIEKTVKPNRFANFINEKVTNNFIIKRIERLWRFLSDTSLLFWPAWMIAVLIVGIGATAFPPALPIIVGVAITASLTLHGIKWLYRYRQKKAEEAVNKGKTKEQVQDEQKESATEQPELSRMRAELKQRLHMKEKYAEFKTIFEIKNDKPTHPNVDQPYRATAIQKRTKDKVIVFVKNPTVASIPSTSAPAVVNEQIIADIENSKIGQHLLGSKAARKGQIAVNMIIATVNNYTQAAFVLWLFSAVFGALAPVAAIFGTLAGIVGGGLMFASFGGIVGSLYSVRAFAETKAAQIGFEKNIYARLSEPYTPSNDSSYKAHAGQLKYDVFNQLLERVEKNKRDLEPKLREEQLRIRIKQKEGQTLTAKEQYLLHYDLKKVNVYNDRYFRTQQEAPSLWTRTKKGLFKTYKAINAGQTSIFVVRSLFLAGAVLGGICLLFGPGAGIAFLAIAFTCAAIGIALKLTQLHMERKAEEKKFFADTIDARISYLKKNDKELKLLKEHLSNHSSSSKVLQEIGTHPTDSPELNPDQANVHNEEKMSTPPSQRRSGLIPGKGANTASENNGYIPLIQPTITIKK